MTDIERLLTLFDQNIKVTHITCFEHYRDTNINFFLTGSDPPELGIAISLPRKEELQALFPEATVYSIPKKEETVVRSTK